MKLITEALAALTAAKARATELIDSEKVIGERIEGCVHALVAEVESLYARVATLEQQAAAKIEGTKDAAPPAADPAQQPPAPPAQEAAQA